MGGVPFYVTRLGGRWFVKLDEKHFGPFTDQREAIDAAVLAARQTQRRQVLVEGNGATAWKEWSY